MMRSGRPPFSSCSPGANARCPRQAKLPFAAGESRRRVIFARDGLNGAIGTAPRKAPCPRNPGPGRPGCDVGVNVDVKTAHFRTVRNLGRTPMTTTASDLALAVSVADRASLDQQFDAALAVARARAMRDRR